MQAEYEENRVRPFVLTNIDLQKLHDELRPYVSEITFQADCADKISRTFSVGDLLQFEHEPPKNISSLKISSSYDSKNRIRVGLHNRAYYNYHLYIEGEETDVIKIREIFSNRMFSMRPWYSFLSGNKITWYYLTLLFAFVIGVFVTLKITDPDALNSKPQNKSWLPTYVPPLLVGGAINIILDKFGMFFFPTGVFAIGQGEKRHQHKELFRTLVIVGFAVSIISGIVTTLLFAAR